MSDLNPIHAAMRLAEEAHRGQKRKGTDIAYITHPMEVCLILTEMRASRELQMAGLLHDTVEDTDVTIEDIRSVFGDRVAALVSGHTEDKELSWRERKQRTIDSLRTAERDVKLLILADKVSNLRSTAIDHDKMGERLWARFNASKEQQSWYNNELKSVLADLQFDAEASAVYCEMVRLYEKLFVK